MRRDYSSPSQIDQTMATPLGGGKRLGGPGAGARPDHPTPGAEFVNILFALHWRTIVQMKKPTRKPAIAKSRAPAPEIYVKTGESNWRGPAMAKAEMRVRAGEYQYLQWREAGTVRSFYLGRKRKA